MLTALVLGIGMFVVCWLVHVAVWRIHRPQGYLIWLPALFVGLPALAGLALGDTASSVSLPPIDILLPAVGLHLLISACYTCSYAGLTEYSPSAEVLRAVREHMPEGVPAENLRVRSFTEHSLTGKRLEDLEMSGLVRIREATVWLTPLGRRLNGLCRIYRLFTGVSARGDG